MVSLRSPVVLALCLLLVPVLAFPDDAVLQLRFAEREEGAGLERMTTVVGDRPYWIHPQIELSETQVDSAFARTDVDTHRPGIELVLTGEGTRRFARLTRENVGRHLAVVLDGELVMAPVIRGAIDGGRLVVSGFVESGPRDRVLRSLAAAGVAVGPPRAEPPPPEEVAARMERYLEARSDSLRAVFEARRGRFAPRDTLLADALAGFGQLWLYQDRPERSRELALLAARVHEQVLPDDPRSRATALDASLRAFAEAGDLGAADRAWERLHPLLTDPPPRLRREMPPLTGVCGLGLAHAKRGRLDRAVEVFEEGLELPYSPLLWACRLGQIECVLLQGEYDRARALCDRAMETEGSATFADEVRDLRRRIEARDPGG